MITSLLARRARAVTAPAIVAAPPAVDVDDCPIHPSPPPRELPFGVWPDDPDEVPAWRIELETKALIYGRVLPSYRTRREFEAAVALCEAAEEHKRTAAKAKATGKLKPMLPPDEAALAFVAMLRATERTGEYAATEIYAAYLDHCTGEDRVPCSERALKMSLERVPGVSSRLAEQQRHGRRHRPTIWTIAEQEDIVPMRRAA